MIYQYKVIQANKVIKRRVKYEIPTKRLYFAHQLLKMKPTKTSMSPKAMKNDIINVKNYRFNIIYYIHSYIRYQMFILLILTKHGKICFCECYVGE